MKTATVRVRDRWGLCAFVIYLALTVLFFGRGVIGHFNGVHLGKFYGDPSLFMWFFTWVPHALRHGHSPLFSDAIWAPQGIDLIWTTWMPLAGLAAWPISATWGPVAAYNAITLPLFALAGWSDFLLCRYLTGSWSASFIGGYLFAFSGYMTFYGWVGDPILLAVFPIPLLILTVARFLYGELTTRRFVTYISILLITLFGIFPEFFATATMFGAMAIALACALYSGETRTRLRASVVPILVSYLLALLILSPYLYCFLSAPRLKGPIWQTFLSSADLLFFFLPSHVSELGHFAPIRHFLDSFPTTIYVGYTYLGPVLLVVVLAFARRHWREPPARLLLVSLVLIAIAAMGPDLIVGGREVMRMPGALVTALPLISSAIPVRFTMYLALDGSLIMALWLSASSANIYAKCATAALAALFIMPSFSGVAWNSADDTPSFFTSGLYRKYLHPNENVLVIPYGWLGNSMTWQAHTRMYFRMAGGYSGIPPREFQRWPAMIALYNGSYLPDAGLQLKAFLAAHRVTAVVVDSHTPDSSDLKQRRDWQIVRTALGPPPAKAGGIFIYRFTPATIAKWPDPPPVELELRTDEARFAALIKASARYLQSGQSVSTISSARLVRMGFIRGDWLGGPDIRISNGLWVKPNADGGVDLGTFGSRKALAVLIAKYRRDARQVKTIDIPSSGVGGGIKGQLELLVVTFDNSGLMRAAALAHSAAATTNISGSVVTTLESEAPTGR